MLAYFQPFPLLKCNPEFRTATYQLTPPTSHPCSQTSNGISGIHTHTHIRPPTMATPGSSGLLLPGAIASVLTYFPFGTPRRRSHVTAHPHTRRLPAIAIADKAEPIVGIAAPANRGSRPPLSQRVCR